MKMMRLFLSAGVFIAVLILTIRADRDHGAGDAGVSESAGTAGLEHDAVDNDWFITQRAYPAADIPAARPVAMRREMKKFESTRRSVDAVHSGQWNSVGPSNIGGRINALAIHPADPNTIYAGAASGGIWKTTDFGGTWSNIFNEGFSIGAVTIDPTNPDVLYVGTGENTPAGVATYPGNGIWRSSDAGATWANIGLGEIGYTGRIAVNPQNPSVIYVAAIGLYRSRTTDRGVYKTTNLGATWNKVLYLNDTTGAIDVLLDPTDTGRVFAAMWTRYRTIHTSVISGTASGLFVSSDGGGTWSPVAGGFPNNSATLGRISFNFAPSDPTIMYATTAVNTGWGGTYKSTDRGTTWTKMFDGTPFNEGQTWYNNVTTIDPGNANHIWVGMTPLYVSTDGGGTFNYASLTGPSHPDYHAVEYAPSDPNVMVLGDDGGIFTSTNGGATWEKSLNLPITQFYAGAVSTQNPWRFMGGTQDNNSIQVLTGRPNEWYAIYGGDGFYTLIDPGDSNYVYAEYQYGVLGYSTDGGNTFTYGATSGIGGSDRHNWSQPIAMDVLNPKTLYTGTQFVYMTTNNMQSWTKISGDLTYGNGGRVGTISTIDVADTDPAVIYVGTDDGRVWATTDQGANWTEIGGTLPGKWVTRVSADPNSASTVYVTLSGFYENDLGSHVYRSTDYGSTWSDIGGSLPDIPANDIVVDPADPNTLYLATDLNVCYTTNLGATWAVLGSNLPSVPVHDLEVHAYPGRTMLTAFTHGRSVYTYDIVPETTFSVGASLSPRWNLVSNPVVTAFDSTNQFFPASLGSAYSYNGLGYVSSGRIAHKSGYWLKFPDSPAQTVTFTGEPVDDEVITVAAGWNIIGSTYKPVPVSAVTSTAGAISSEFYGYSGGYIAADTIMPGHAYWVRMSSAGSLTLHTTGAAPKHTVPAPRIMTFTVTDATGNRQTLEVTSASTAEAPPPAPDGSFDSRFTSQRLVESMGGAAVRSIPISITGVAYPATISWRNGMDGVTGTVYTGKGTGALQPSGAITIEGPADGIAVMVSRGSETAHRFALSQNYPNPFNPRTTIRYSIASAGSVMLDVFNTSGQKVANLVNSPMEPGEYAAEFDGSGVSSGTYYYRLTAPGGSKTRKFLLVK